MCSLLLLVGLLGLFSVCHYYCKQHCDEWFPSLRDDLLSLHFERGIIGTRSGTHFKL